MPRDPKTYDTPDVEIAWVCDPDSRRLGPAKQAIEQAQENFRINTEVIYMRNSPVGYSSIPYLVGGNGTVFNLTIEFFF